MLKSQFDDNPNTVLTRVGYVGTDGKRDAPDDEIGRQIESHSEEALAGLET